MLAAAPPWSSCQRHLAESECRNCGFGGEKRVGQYRSTTADCSALPSPASQGRAPDNRIWSFFLQYEGRLNGAFFSPQFPSAPEGRSQRCSWAGGVLFPGADRTPGYLTDSLRAFCPITGSWLCLTRISHSTPFLPSPDTTRVFSLGWWAASQEVQPFVGSLFWSRCPRSSQTAA